MFIVYFLLGVLILSLYGLLGIGVMWLIDEVDAFDELNIDVCDYPLAFVFFWPILLIAIIGFGVKQMINLVVDMFTIEKE